MNKLTVTFAVGAKSHVVTGQIARTLRALVEKGQKGVTALEMSTWALRLAAYVHILRTQCGLAIITLWENHPGGKHGRYVLQTTVQILK